MERPRLSRRTGLLIGVAVFVGAALRAGTGEVVNERGWSSFARFWTAVRHPVLDGDFLRLTLDAAVTTAGVAVLGTALSLVLGAAGAFVLSRLVWGDAPLPRLASLVLVVPRAVHEILWALLFVQVLGFDPLVAVIAIGVPFGAVTAKVFAETIDETDPAPYRALRAGGAGRVPALAYGILPRVRGELTSYAFYRLECALRSAAVLGVVGLGGLGYQLDLSFQTLRYGEMWTLLGALVVLSGLVEGLSALVRRARRAGGAGGGSVRVGSLPPGAVVVLVVAGIAAAWWVVGIHPSHLWSARTRTLGTELLGEVWPPRAGPGGLGVLAGAAVDTIAMSVLASGFAVAVAVGVVLVAGRPGAGFVPRAATAALALFARAVPAPVWAFLVVLVLFPGPWPGAVALGVYEAGVLGRLFVEAVTERGHRHGTALVGLGATPLRALLYGDLPEAASRLAALSLYRWEVVVRDTLMVGVVGAGGLGQLVRDHLAARDLAAVTSVVLALVVVTAAIDTVSLALRQRLR
ncbi:MAG: ABC transporter permease subunit [Actinomyces sp.]|nr:MAG: ABC transporter permease subunit [Actinomyces sp.]